eukprot:6517284-Prorocentrum_lima.AAC.1
MPRQIASALRPPPPAPLLRATLGRNHSSRQAMMMTPSAAVAGSVQKEAALEGPATAPHLCLQQRK